MLISAIEQNDSVINQSVSQFSHSVVSDSLQPHGLQHARLPCHHQLLEFTKLMSTESVMPSSRLIFCHPLLLLPSVFPSIRFFSNESVLCIRWPKYWSFSFNISPSNEYSGLILQHHSSKALILLCSAFFIVQLSYPSIHEYSKNFSFD